MKKFEYFESQEGGMDHFTVTTSLDLRRLYGWMNDDCETSDLLLLRWMDSTDVGEMYEHRLGIMVRIKDR